MSKASTSSTPAAESAAGSAKRPKSPRSSDRGERRTQVTLQMRESLHRELARRAFESGMTMRGFIMSALKKAGLKVTDQDMVDRRRR